MILITRQKNLLILVYEVFNPYGLFISIQNTWFLNFVHRKKNQVQFRLNNISKYEAIIQVKQKSFQLGWKLTALLLQQGLSMPIEFKTSGTCHYSFETSSSAIIDTRYWQWPERSMSGSCYNFCIIIDIVQLFLVSNGHSHSPARRKWSKCSTT